MKKIVEMWNRVSLIAKILVGIVIGAVLGLLVPGATGIDLIGTMFVRALKAIAPILVFALVISSIANAGKGNGQQFRMVTIMYMLSTLCAAVVAVSASFIFPVTMTLDLESYQADVVPSGIMEVLQNLLLNITDNPVNAILNANYLCILAWALLFGLAMRRTSKSIKSALVSISDAVSTVRGGSSGAHHLESWDLCSRRYRRVDCRYSRNMADCCLCLWAPCLRLH